MNSQMLARAVRRMILGLCTALLVTPAPTIAQDIPFQVLPWNGHKAALSLTYDDGDPIHLDLAVPEMDKRGIRGTLFPIAGKLERQEDWRKAAKSGHEIGNHSWSHRRVAELGPGEETAEVGNADDALEDATGATVLTFAYPFTETSPALKDAVGSRCFLARIGGGTDLTPGMEPDWLALPSRTTLTDIPFGTYQGWVDGALGAGAWTILMIHAIEGSDWWQPISKPTYVRLLDYLVEKRKELWVAPFGEVGAYWRAQKVLEAVEPLQEGARLTYRWKAPDHFPTGTVLKVRLKDPGSKLLQGGLPLIPLPGGEYPVSFDTQEMALEKDTKG